MKMFVITIVASMFVAASISFAHGGIIARTGKVQVDEVELLVKAEKP